MRHVLEFLFDRHTHFKLAGGDALFMRRLAGIKCFLTQVLSREEEEDTAAAADSEGKGEEEVERGAFFRSCQRAGKEFRKEFPSPLPRSSNPPLPIQQPFISCAKPVAANSSFKKKEKKTFSFSLFLPAVEAIEPPFPSKNRKCALLS